MRVEGIFVLSLFSIMATTLLLDPSSLKDYHPCEGALDTHCDPTSLSARTTALFYKIVLAVRDFMEILFLGRDIDKFWFVWSWCHTLGYIAICTCIYHLYTKPVMAGERSPITAKWLTVWTIGHNLFLAFLSALFFIGFAYEWLVRAKGALCTADFWAEEHRFWMDFFYFSKALEQIDTVLRLLSGRIRVNVLLFQMYHHSTQPILIYVIQHAHYDLGFPSLFLNALAHIPAYLIYAADSAKGTYPKMVKHPVVANGLRLLRRVNPPIQISQFVISTVLNYSYMPTSLLDYCLYNSRWPAAFVACHVFYFVYFVWFCFLVNEYNSIKPSTRATTRRASFAPSDIHYVTGTPYCKRKLSDMD